MEYNKSGPLHSKPSVGFDELQGTEEEKFELIIDRVDIRSIMAVSFDLFISTYLFVFIYLYLFIGGEMRATTNSWELPLTKMAGFSHSTFKPKVRAGCHESKPIQSNCSKPVNNSMKYDELESTLICKWDWLKISNSDAQWSFAWIEHRSALICINLHRFA